MTVTTERALGVIPPGYRREDGDCCWKPHGTLCSGCPRTAPEQRQGAHRIHLGIGQMPPMRERSQRLTALAVRDGQEVAGPEDDEDEEAKDIAKQGSLLLRLICAYLGTYTWFRSPADRDTVALWIVHAAARNRNDAGIGQLIWHASPRLMLTSAENGSGKSTVLDLIGLLTRATSGIMAKVTPRAFANVVGGLYEVALVDEAKLMFGSGEASRELQALLLAGYLKRGTYNIGSQRGDNKVVPVYGAVAWAGKDEVITGTGDKLADLLARSLMVRLARPPKLMREVGERAEAEAAMLAGTLIQWTNRARPYLKAAAESIEEEDRAASEARAKRGLPLGDAPRLWQIWRPLRAVARTAGPEWETRADAARRAGGPAGELDQQLADLEARLLAGSGE